MADIKNIVSFGCSWTFGDELLDHDLKSMDIDHTNRKNDKYRLENCYTGILAKEHNLIQNNFGYPGSSLQSMIWNLVWWTKNTDIEDIKSSLVLVGLTGEDRTSWFDPRHEPGFHDPTWHRHVHSTWLNTSELFFKEAKAGWRKLKKYYYAFSHSDELSQINIDTTTLMFDSIGYKYNIPVIQFNTVARKKPNNIDSFYDIDVTSLLSKENYAKNQHPNESGHKIIANEITKIINTNKLLS